MSTTARVGGFVLGLVAVAGAATATRCRRRSGRSRDRRPRAVGTAPADRGQALPRESARRSELPGGLMVSQDGYSLQVLDDRIHGPGPRCCGSG